MRRPLIAALPLVLAAACSQQTTTSNTVDINAAATAAQGDIDTYAANALQNEPVAATTPTPGPTSAPLPSSNPDTTNPPAPGEPGGLPDDRTPISEAPFPPDSAQGAANVVQTYFALVEEGKYGQAYRLWSQNGQASGIGRAEFAQSFAKYSEYHANVGAPGRVDAGAGQRYVTVPVQVYGRLKAGNRAFNQRGDVVLHRTADIDGATAEEKTWHINSVELKTAGKQGD